MQHIKEEVDIFSLYCASSHGLSLGEARVIVTCQNGLSGLDTESVYSTLQSVSVEAVQ